MMEIEKAIREFITGDYQGYPTEFSVKQSLVDIKDKDEKYVYNEFSFQHELGNYLRHKLGKKYIVKFEYNINDLDFEKEFETCKKEIDILIINKSNKEKYAIELKYLKNKAIPYRMFQCIQDMKFMHQAISNIESIKEAYCVTVTTNKEFYEGIVPPYSNELIEAYQERLQDLKSKKEKTNEEKDNEIMIEELINNKLKEYSDYPCIYNYFREGHRKIGKYVFSQLKSNPRAIDISKFTKELENLKWYTVDKENQKDKNRYYIIKFK